MNDPGTAAITHPDPRTLSPVPSDESKRRVKTRKQRRPESNERPLEAGPILPLPAGTIPTPSPCKTQPSPPSPRKSPLNPHKSPPVPRSRRDQRRVRSRSRLSSNGKDIKASAPERFQTVELVKEDSVPGVLVASPVRSSSTSLSYHTGHPQGKTGEGSTGAATETTGDLSEKAPSISRSQFDLSCMITSAPANQSTNQIQDDSERQQQPNRPEWDTMSCASTKASTSSLLNLAPRREDIGICLEAEDQGSRKGVLTHIHGYSVDSPPKTVQDRESEIDIGGSSVSLISDTISSSSSKKRLRAALHPARQYDQRAFPAESIKMISPKAPANSFDQCFMNQKTTSTIESHMKSPQTQSLTTTTHDSSASVQKEHLAALRQNVLNHEVTDSVLKIVFDMDQSSSTYSPTRKQPLKKRFARAASNIEKNPNNRGKRRSHSNINVFSPGYYLQRRVLYRQASTLFNCPEKDIPLSKRGKLNTGHGRRSQSFVGHTQLHSENNNSKPLRRSVSLPHHDNDTKDVLSWTLENPGQPSNNMDETEAETQEGISFEFKKIEDTTNDHAMGDEDLNTRRSVSFESGSEHQDGILEVEQPSLQDIDTDRLEESIGNLDGNVQGGNNEAGNRSEDLLFHHSQPQPTKSPNNMDVLRSAKEHFFLVSTRRENDIGQSMQTESRYSEQPLQSCKLVEGVEIPITDGSNLHHSVEPCGATTSLLESNSNPECQCDSSCTKKTEEISAINETHTAYTSRLQCQVRKKRVRKRNSAHTFNDSHFFTEKDTPAKVHELGHLNAQKENGNFDSMNLNKPNIEKYPYDIETGQTDTKKTVKSMIGRCAKPSHTKRHVPVSTLIADISDISNRQHQTSGPGKAVADSPFGSALSLVEKLSESSVKRYNTSSRESIAVSDCSDKSSLMKHPTQNVSHLRRVRNFYGKRQMRITRSVGLMQHPVNTEENNLNRNEQYKKSDDQTFQIEEKSFRNEDFNHYSRFNECRKAKSNLSIHKNEIQCRRKEIKSDPEISKDLKSKTESKEELEMCSKKPGISSGGVNVSKSGEMLLDLVNKPAVSGSTNNSSNNVPHRRDTTSVDSMATATFHSTAQTGSLPPHRTVMRLGGPALASYFTAVSVPKVSVTHNSAYIYKTQAVEKVRRASRDKIDKTVKRPQTIKKAHKKQIFDDNSKNPNTINCEIIAAPQNISKQQIPCRQNVSSTLRKAHALARRTDMEQTLSTEGAFMADSGRTSMLCPRPLASRPSARRKTLPFIRLSEILNLGNDKDMEPHKVSLLAEEDTLVKHQKTPDDSDLEQNLLTKLEALFPQFSTPSDNCEAPSVDPVTSSQKGSNPDSGYDEAISMSEHTGDQTFSVSSKFQHTFPIIKEDDSTLLTQRGNQFDDSTHHITPHEIEEPASSGYLNVLEVYQDEDDIALISDVDCTEQDTSSVNTDEVFLSRGSSFFAEQDIGNKQQHAFENSLHLTLTQKTLIHKESLVVSTCESQHEDIADNIVSTPTHGPPLEAFKSPLSNKSGLTSLLKRKADHPVAKLDSQKRLSPSSSCVYVHAIAEPDNKMAQIACRKTESADTVTYTVSKNKRRRRRKQKNGSYSCSPKSIPDHNELSPMYSPKTRLSEDTGGYEQFQTDLELKDGEDPSPLAITGYNPMTGLSETTREGEHLLTDTEQIESEDPSPLGITDSITESASPGLDCMCMWTASPCQCVNGHLSSISSLESVQLCEKQKTSEYSCINATNEDQVGPVKKSLIDQPGKSDANSWMSEQSQAKYDKDTCLPYHERPEKGNLVNISGFATADCSPAFIVELHKASNIEFHANMAAQVSLPPTSSDDDEDENCETRQKIQSSKYGSIKDKSRLSSPKAPFGIHTDKDIPCGDTTNTFFTEGYSSFSNAKQTEPESCVSISNSPPICAAKESMQVFFANRKPESTTLTPILSASHVTEAEKQTHDQSTPPELNSSVTTPKPRPDRDTLSHAPEKVSLKSLTRSVSHGCSPAVFSTHCPSSPVAAKVQLLATHSKSCTSNTDIRSTKRVKIERRSVAFKDLLKRF